MTARQIRWYLQIGMMFSVGGGAALVAWSHVLERANLVGIKGRDAWITAACIELASISAYLEYLDRKARGKPTRAVLAIVVLAFVLQLAVQLAAAKTGGRWALIFAAVPVCTFLMMFKFAIGWSEDAPAQEEETCSESEAPVTSSARTAPVGRPARPASSPTGRAASTPSTAASTVPAPRALAPGTASPAPSDPPASSTGPDTSSESVPARPRSSSKLTDEQRAELRHAAGTDGSDLERATRLAEHLGRIPTSREVAAGLRISNGLASTVAKMIREGASDAADSRPSVG